MSAIVMASDRTFEFFGLELLVQCASCAAVTPVNRPEQRTLCSNCRQETNVDDDTWKSALELADARLVKNGLGVLEAKKLERPGRNVEWTRGPDRPRCACGGSMRASPDGTRAVCTGCGADRALEPPPDFMMRFFPQIVGFIADPVPASTSEPKELAMSCTKCGASISSDGSSRTVDCSYCHATNILADEVWRALHPPKLRRRFWLLFTPDPRRVAPDPTRELRNTLLAMIPFIAFVAIFPAMLTARLRDDDSGHDYWVWFGGLYGLVLIVSVMGWNAVRGHILPSQEIAGRLRPWLAGGAQVELFDPRAPDAILATKSVRLSEGAHASLGGAGALVRAWRKPGSAKFVIRLEPSGLG